MKTKIEELKKLATQKPDCSTIPQLCANVHINAAKGYIDTNIIPLLLDIIEKQHKTLKAYEDSYTTTIVKNSDGTGNGLVYSQKNNLAAKTIKETTEMLEGVEL